jgi:signal transduction histidine kinase
VGELAARRDTLRPRAADRLDRSLIEAALAVNDTPSVEAAFRVLAAQARALLRSETASVIVWDSELGGGTVRAVAGPPLLGSVGEAVDDRSPAAAAASTGQPQRVESIGPMGSHVSVPIVSAEGGPVTLQVGWRVPGTGAQLDGAIRVLTELAGLTRLAVSSHLERARCAGADVVEHFLEDLFQALPTAVGVSDPVTGALVKVNPALTELTGLSAAELLGVTPPYPWVASAEAARPSGEIPMLVRHKSGRLTPVEVKRLVVDGPSGEAARVSLITDFGERQRFEQQLIQSGKLASIGELAAGVAHEINNPLFAILGLTEFLLEDAEPGSKARERLEVIRTTGLEIKDIVRSLLDFARERSDELITVSLADVARQTVELFRRTSAAKHVEFVERYPEEPTAVEASPNQLKQIFVNLFSNARQAMSGGGVVTVEVVREGEHVVARVADDGPGIPDGTLPRIFEPFYTTKRDLGGTGLGLSVSLGIAQAHGGSLTVRSQPGEGACFTLSLPAKGVEA